MWAWQEIDCSDKNRQDERVKESQGSSIANKTFFLERKNNNRKWQTLGE